MDTSRAIGTGGRWRDDRLATSHILWHTDTCHTERHTQRDTAKGSNMKTATFRVDGRGEWRWALDADNGETLAVSSEGYKRSADAVRCFELTTGAVVESEHRQVAVRIVTVQTGDHTERNGSELVPPSAVPDGIPTVHTRRIAEAIEVIGLP